MEIVEGIDISFNVISKSETTTEALWFLEYVRNKYEKQNAMNRICVAVDKSKAT